jgi:hypothetical protein
MILSSVSDPDPHGSAWIRIQLVARIRIRIRNADPDPDPGGLKKAKMKKKNAAKSQIISHKSIKINTSMYR